MEKRKGCTHQNILALYGRDKNNWISSLKISGKMIYMCADCGAMITAMEIADK